MTAETRLKVLEAEADTMKTLGRPIGEKMGLKKKKKSDWSWLQRELSSYQFTRILRIDEPVQ